MLQAVGPWVWALKLITVLASHCLDATENHLSEATVMQCSSIKQLLLRRQSMLHSPQLRKANFTYHSIQFFRTYWAYWEGFFQPRLVKICLVPFRDLIWRFLLKIISGSATLGWVRWVYAEPSGNISQNSPRRHGPVVKLVSCGAYRPGFSPISSPMFFNSCIRWLEITWNLPKQNCLVVAYSDRKS